jgi:nitrite reductase (NADH) large subunit
MGAERLVVIGNGMAGLRFVEELLERAPGRFELTVIGAEPEPAYNRVLLSSLLAGDIGAADVRMRSREWYAEKGIALRTAQIARAIDPVARAVALDSGEAVPFDRLVLATGSEPIRIPVPGCELPGVMTFRSLVDIDRLQVAGASNKPAVVIGGGLLGIEAAFGLVRRGVPVTLLHLMDRLMERHLDAEGAQLLLRAVEGKGVLVELDAHTRAIHGTDAVEVVELADGRLVPCGLVVMAVGIRPSMGLVRDTGIATARGILVDDAMQTSVPGIYAVGECAEHRSICYGLVEPCYEQARVAAAAIAGTSERYQGSLLATHLKVSGVPVFSGGDWDGSEAETIFIRDPAIPSYRKLVVREHRLVGAVLVGDTSDAPWYSELIRSGTTVAAFRESLAFGQAFVEAA